MTIAPAEEVSPDLRLWRDAQRAALLRARCSVPLPQRRLWDQAITRRVLQHFAALGGWVVGGYWPFRSEFDPRFTLRQWRLDGSRVALPVVVKKNTPLQFRAWWPGAPMVKTVLGLPVPDGTDWLVPRALLIPPVGFDAQGYRLGYGGGYFDRTLAALGTQVLKIGVAYELSRMPTIRPLAHDIAMDFIVTEQGLYRVTHGGLVAVEGAWRWR